MAALSALGGIVSGVGTIIGGGQQRSQSYLEASQTLQLAKGEAQAIRAEGTQQLVAGQVKSQETQRDVALTLSKERALAAASGGGVSNPTVMNILANTAQRGSYLSRIPIYEGKTAQANAFAQAKGTILGAKLQGQALRASGDMAETNADLSGAGSILSGIGTAYSKYG